MKIYTDDAKVKKKKKVSIACFKRNKDFRNKHAKKLVTKSQILIFASHLCRVFDAASDTISYFPLKNLTSNYCTAIQY